MILVHGKDVRIKLPRVVAQRGGCTETSRQPAVLGHMPGVSGVGTQGRAAGSARGGHQASWPTPEIQSLMYDGTVTGLAEGGGREGSRWLAKDEEK